MSDTSLAAPACPRGVSESRARTFPRLQHVAATLVVVGAPMLVFSGALWNGFVWDDHFNFEMNSGYRGLGWSHLQWMFTNNVDAHWIPLTWFTFGVDYLLWGMNPVGYHLSNLLFHAVAAWLLFLVALRLLRLAGASTDDATLTVGAAAASVFFSIHPLRAESVVWITERRDVVSGVFVLLAVLAYLRAQEPPSERRRLWMAACLVSFQLAVLSKSIAITLPVILLLLDIYPLRRLDTWPTAWLRAANRRVILEKLPFVPMAVLASVVAMAIIGGLNRFTPLTPLERLVTVTYSFWFYLWKTIVPAGLLPLYEMPIRVDPAEPRFVVGAIATLAVSVLVVALVRRWPAALAAWLAYVVMIGPVSGVKHTGIQLVADRYSYLSCIPWALLFGAGVCALIHARQIASERLRWRLVSTAVMVGLVGLAVLASYQTTLWRTPERLWRYAVSSDPRCFVCQHNLGTTLLKQGRTGEAIGPLERAVALREPAPLTHAALVMANLAGGDSRAAYDHLDAVGRFDRDLARELAALFITAW